jgi:hypothetical protein
MATALRAAIMLLVLVGGPCAWMYYGPLPDGAQRVVDRFVHAAKDAFNGQIQAVDAPLATAGMAAPKPQAAAVTDAAPPFDPTLTTTARAPSPFEQRVAPLLAKLKQLGAVTYDLEPWGEGGRMFRFRCELALVPGGQATEQFEAVAADPQQSIELVSSQVATRHAAHSSAIQ